MYLTSYVIQLITDDKILYWNLILIRWMFSIVLYFNQNRLTRKVENVTHIKSAKQVES